MKTFLLLSIFACFFAIGAKTQVGIHPDSIETTYHENGFVKMKKYRLYSGLRAYVVYSDTAKGQIINGSLSNSAKLHFKNNQLVEISGKRYKHPALDNNHSALPPSIIGSCSQKGRFENFELHNGFIYYYDKKGNRTLTEKVVNGIIQYNPRVSLSSQKLKNNALREDLNFNGRVEKRETDLITVLNFHLDSAEIERFPFNELYKFRKLKRLVINNLQYTVEAYSSKSALKKAVKNNEGKPIEIRTSWGVPMPPDHIVERPLPSIFDPAKKEDADKIHQFPDMEAKFPDGNEALLEYFEKNLRYPPNAKLDSTQGKVYTSFVVERDGSITNVKVDKHLSKECDNEAIRLISNMPNWIPAECQGKPCRSLIRLPVIFKLH